MSRVVVTGGSGFLGSHIADRLSEEGHRVVVFDTRPSPWLRAGQKMVVGSLLDPAAVMAACEGAEAVFHLGALADLEEAGRRPVETAQTNVLGTVHALEAARAAAARRFVFASTVYVYSRAGGFYRCSKQAGEAYVEEYRRRFGLPFTILRFGSLYGPRSTKANGVHRLLDAARSGRVELVGTADDTREYIHVEDAARLSVAALDAAHEDRHLVITGHHPMRLKDLFTMFSEILGQPLEVEYREPEQGAGSDHHYRITPYAYTPRAGRKITSNSYVDMGQGILQMLTEMAGEEPGGEA